MRGSRASGGGEKGGGNMVAEIICVGTELLMGQVLNTNTKFLSERLGALGVDLYHQLVVGDNPGRLKEAVGTAFSRADIVFFSGGLGPTEDDLTKQTVAEAMGLGPLVLYDEEWEKIVRWFARTNRVPTPNNKRQAEFPREGCTILPNPMGTAPGCIFEKDGKTAVLMPGPPRELCPMFLNYVVPFLHSKSDHMLYSRELRVFGLGESSLEQALMDMIDGQTDPTLATYAETGECKLRVTTVCRSEEEGEQKLAPTLAEIRRRIGDVIYSEHGVPLPLVCRELLEKKGLTLAAAEDCTLGQLTAALCGEELSAALRLFKTVPAIPDPEAAAEALLPESGAALALVLHGDRQTGDFTVVLRNGVTSEKTEFNLRGNPDSVRARAVLRALDILRRKLCTI